MGSGSFLGSPGTGCPALPPAPSTSMAPVPKDGLVSRHGAIPEKPPDRPDSPWHWRAVQTLVEQGGSGALMA